MSQFTFVSTEQDDPFARLRRLAEGKHIRVYLTEPHPDSYSDDGHLLSAQLRGVAENGLVVTWNREAERVTELLPWDSIHRVVTRRRAREHEYGCGCAFHRTFLFPRFAADFFGFAAAFFFLPAPFFFPAFFFAPAASAAGAIAMPPPNAIAVG